ncbi:GNAT family N-acetyltransferase [Acetobacteraceae bacterium KSS8]|uniref:GNAT family N-acetyltransferase n=1 Tax=Endosaccharibacter trunci TaxID=2812733 RepID=A0ABT1W4M8_9PROT|nr:GNAT family N-acetyltransferase [Acetobacteraceae bacterium KSS8]
MADPAPLRVERDDLRRDQSRALVAAHLAGMHRDSPPDAVFALPVDALLAPDIRIWSAWRGDRIAGIGALRVLSDHAGEVKCMRTHADFLRQGVAAAILDRIVAEARAAGLKRLSLETGNGLAFQPALSLYRTKGFRDGAPFADYVENGHSVFLHRDLVGA